MSSMFYKLLILSLMICFSQCYLYAQNSSSTTQSNNKACKASFNYYNGASKTLGKSCTASKIGKKSKCIERYNRCIQTGTDSKTSDCPLEALNNYISLKNGQQNFESRYQSSKTNVEQLSDKLNELNQQSLDLQSQLKDANLEIQMIKQKGLKDASQFGRKKAADILILEDDVDNIQIDIDKAKASKSTAKIKTNNAKDDITLDCQDKAIARYSKELDGCLTNRKKKIKNGRYYTSGLFQFVSGKHPGSCFTDKKKQEYFQGQYTLMCTERNKIKMQRHDTALIEFNKSVNQTIRKFKLDKVKAQDKIKSYKKDALTAENEFINDQNLINQQANNKMSRLIQQIALHKNTILTAKNNLEHAKSSLDESERNKIVNQQNYLESNLIKGKNEVQDDIKVGRMFIDVFNFNSMQDTATDTCCTKQDSGRFKAINNDNINICSQLSRSITQDDKNKKASPTVRSSHKGNK